MRLPTYFISHGGGPWPWLDGPFRRVFDRLESSLREIAAATPVPRAVLVVSGHWVAPQFTVQSGKHPAMVYDYSGFRRTPIRSSILHRAHQPSPRAFMSC
jgi:aromatic ring-opening dioxygenase catalytic subunit (LigB family)